MATVKEFKNKITKAQEDLFKALDAEKVKKATLSQKIVQELSKQGKANVKSLNSLNKEYLEVCKNNALNLQHFIDTVKQLNDDLDNSIEVYNKHYEENDELKVLSEQNDKKLSTIKSKNKREIQDINIKIDRIDKELKETLEVRQNEYETNEASFKSKVIELDKRKRFEVGKIQNNTIKEYDELQKRLLKENKRSEIKNINKKIKQIRYNGLVDEKECIFRHLAEQRQYELDYVKNDYEFKMKSINIEKEYKDRIEDVKFDRSMIEHNHVKNVDKHNNGVNHTFNNNDKEYKNNHCDELEKLYSSIKEANDSLFNCERDNENVVLECGKKIYSNIESIDNQLINKYNELYDKELVFVDKQVSLFQKNINFTLSFYIQNINSIYNTYFSDIIKKEKELLDMLLINVVDGKFLQGNDYSQYVRNVNDLFETFSNNEQQYLQYFNDTLNELLNNFLIQVEQFINGINNLNEKVKQYVNEYHSQINIILNQARENGLMFAEKVMNDNLQNIDNKNNESNELNNSRNNQLKQQRIDIENEFNEREASVKKIEDEQASLYEQQYNKLVKVKEDAKVVINENYNAFSNQYLVDYENKVKAINDKFNIEIANVEKDYKVKMGLL